MKILDEHGIPIGSVDEVNGNTVVIDGRWQTAWYQVLRDAPDPPKEEDLGPTGPPDAGSGTGTGTGTGAGSDVATGSDVASGADVATGAEVVTWTESKDTGESSKSSGSKSSSCTSAPGGSSTHVVWLFGLMSLAWYRLRQRRRV